MSKEELIAYLKDSLSIHVDTRDSDYSYDRESKVVTVGIYLEGHLIAEGSDTFSVGSTY